MNLEEYIKTRKNAGKTALEIMKELREAGNTVSWIIIKSIYNTV